MSIRKRTIATALAIALSGAGIAYSFADTTPSPAKETAPTQVDEQVSGGATAQQQAKMAQQGLVAVRDVHLARMAINDGYTDHAKELLGHAQKLLSSVKSESQAVTVTTEVKVGDKEARSDKRTVTPDLIPILSELQVVEDFAPQSDKAAAVKQAKAHLSNGKRDQAVETLRLAEVGLVSLDVSMPLGATITHVDQAVKLIDAGKLHEANLALKKVGDALVKETSILVQPIAHNAGHDGAGSPQTPAADAGASG